MPSLWAVSLLAILEASILTIAPISTIFSHQKNVIFTQLLSLVSFHPLLFLQFCTLTTLILSDAFSQEFLPSCKYHPPLKAMPTGFNILCFLNLLNISFYFRRSLTQGSVYFSTTFSFTFPYPYKDIKFHAAFISSSLLTSSISFFLPFPSWTV